MNSGRSWWPACIQQLREQRATLGSASTKVRMRQVLAAGTKDRVGGRLSLGLEAWKTSAGASVEGSQERERKRGGQANRRVRLPSHSQA